MLNRPDGARNNNDINNNKIIYIIKNNFFFNAINQISPDLPLINLFSNIYSTIFKIFHNLSLKFNIYFLYYFLKYFNVLYLLIIYSRLIYTLLYSGSIAIFFLPLIILFNGKDLWFVIWRSTPPAGPRRGWGPSGPNGDEIEKTIVTATQGYKTLSEKVPEMKTSQGVLNTFSQEELDSWGGPGGGAIA